MRMRYIKLFEEATKSLKQLRNNTVKVFYTPKQVLKDVEKSYSKSPQKPMLLMKKFKEMGVDKHFDIDSEFLRFEREDFLVAHTPEYVDAVLDGTDLKLRDSNHVPWTKELAETVRYTNSSLYNAIKYSLEHPETPCFSPTSGFHHAHPDRGAGFCTFAGQVIASVKLYREKGVSGAYFDLDGHFGNSIEDCRGYTKDLNKAVPPGFNINPQGRNGEYLEYLIKACHRVEKAILDGEIDYIVWCHGADSHEHDDLGGQVSTKYWVKAAEVFYEWVKSVDIKLNDLGRKPIPLTMCLFGGYRKDSYDSVLSLHTKDMVLCLNILCGHGIEYEAEVKPKEILHHDEEDLNDNEQEILDFLKQQGNDDYFTIGQLPYSVETREIKAIVKKLMEYGYLESNGRGYRYKSE